jgi:hypothetical protein
MTPFSLLVANKTELRKAKGIQKILRMLEIEDPDVRKNIAFALSIVLEDCKNSGNVYLPQKKELKKKADVFTLSSCCPHRIPQSWRTTPFGESIWKRISGDC